MSTVTPTLLWHDYETWGANPHSDWPCQFAAIRTDMDLNPIEKPINWFCKIPNDYLPHPQACLITGITPQQSLRDGYIEPDFVAKVHQQLSTPGSCVVGYNSIRFDDEVSRFTLFRNFYDPYAREWQHGNSRWDLIDLVRACYALRPEGIEWPLNDQELPSFKLEHLAAANKLNHESAHDALSDVYATIGLAKLIKTKQPKLFEYGFSLRSKRTVAEKLNIHAMTPIVHISSRFKSAHGCCSIVMPIAMHPSNKNAVICIDLCEPTDNLLDHSSAELRDLLYRKTAELSSDEQRPALKLIHINKSPFIAPLATLTDENAERLGLSKHDALQRRETLLAHSGVFQTLVDVFDTETSTNPDTVDPDSSLYAEPFLTPAQKQWCEQVVHAQPEMLAELMQMAPTNPLKTRLFRYRARNYPQTLNIDESQQWQAYRQNILMHEPPAGRLSLPVFMDELGLLAEQVQNDPNKLAILKALANYAQNL